jgi:hypothetical protein
MQFENDEGEKDRVPFDFDKGNMINILADSNKIMNTSIVGSDDEHYKQRIRDLFILTKDMQKNQRVTLDEFKFFGKSSAASKDQLSFNTQRFFMNGSLK